MKNNPLVSVIMPAYNAQKYIGDAIESILTQTYDRFELIIVDDCSTDDTVNIIKTYGDYRLHFLRNDVNSGISYTTNCAIKESSGKYIALLDDDDIACQDRLRFQVEFLENRKEIDVLGGKTIYVDENNNELCRDNSLRTNPKYLKAMLMFKTVDFSNSSVMYRRDFFERNHLWYREGCLGMQDFDFYIRSSKVGRITSIDEYLVRHRMHDECETEREMREHGMARAELFSKFQRDSIEEEGFKLSEQEYMTLRKAFPENQIVCMDFSEWNNVGKVLKKMCIQGKNNSIDYVDELRHYFRSLMTQMLCKIDFIDEAF